MPYTSPERRNMIVETCLPKDLTSGDLNELFTEVINIYRFNKKDSYKTYNDILGALEGTKMEFYRRIVLPYEETKRAQNGDVY